MILQALVNANDEIIHYSKHCVFGNFEDEDKWMFYSNTRDDLPVPELYALDNDFHVVDFDDSDLPEDYTFGKYKLLTDGTFVLNPDYHEPEPSPEEKIAALQEEIDELKELIELQSEALDYIIMNNM